MAGRLLFQGKAQIFRQVTKLQDLHAQPDLSLVGLCSQKACVLAWSIGQLVIGRMQP